MVNAHEVTVMEIMFMCSYIEAADDEITVSAKRASVYVVNKIAYLHSESFPIPYIVHYMPFTV